MADIKTETFTLAGVTVTCREPLAMDRFDVRAIYKKLKYDRDDPEDFERGVAFADYVLKSRVVGLEWWVDIRADETALNAAFVAWQALPSDLLELWDNVLWSLNPKSFSSASS